MTFTVELYGSDKSLYWAFWLKAFFYPKRSSFCIHLNPTALKMAKTQQSFGHSECNRVNAIVIYYDTFIKPILKVIVTVLQYLYIYWKLKFLWIGRSMYKTSIIPENVDENWNILFLGFHGNMWKILVRTMSMRWMHSQHETFH